MNNPRPGGLLGFLDVGWRGTTLNERIQAQNLWDLGKAQEEANKIAREQLKQNSENARQLELKDQKIAEQQELIDKLLSNKRKKENKVKYNTKLCDWLHIDYNDLLNFTKVLSEGSAKLSEEKDKLYEDMTNERDEIRKQLLKRQYEDKSQEAVKYIAQKYIDFSEFRKDHYNKEMENLFFNIKLPVFVIDTNEIRGYGTVQEYMDYILNIVTKNRGN